MEGPTMTAPDADPTAKKSPRRIVIIICAVTAVLVAGAITAGAIAAGRHAPIAPAAAAASTAPSTTPSPTPSPTMGFAAACTEALKLLTSDSINIVTDFVNDPSLASVDEQRLTGVIDRMQAVGPSLPPAVSADWDQLTGVIVKLRTAKLTGTNDTVQTGLYPDLAPGVITACGPYVPDGALATTPVAAPAKPTKKAVPTIDEGTWTVGEDVPAGTYKVVENAGSDCYWARLKPNGDIIANYLGGGRPKVSIRKGEQFQTSGCPTFKKVG